MPTGVESHSRVHVTEFRFSVVIIRRFPSFPTGNDIGFMHMRLRSSLPYVDWKLAVLLLATHVGLGQSLSSSCLRFRLLILPAVHAHAEIRCASRSVSNHFRSPGFTTLTAAFDNCGRLPMTTFGCRSSSVCPTIGSLGRVATQILQSHHLTVCRLDGSALCEVLQTRQLRVFGSSSCSSRCARFAALHIRSTAAASSLTHNYVPSRRHFAFPSIEFVHSNCVVTHRSFPSFAVVRDRPNFLCGGSKTTVTSQSLTVLSCLDVFSDVHPSRAGSSSLPSIPSCSRLCWPKELLLAVVLSAR